VDLSKIGRKDISWQQIPASLYLLFAEQIPGGVLKGINEIQSANTQVGYFEEHIDKGTPHDNDDQNRTRKTYVPMVRRWYPKHTY
jgi:hypothetical protein